MFLSLPRAILAVALFAGNRLIPALPFKTRRPWASLSVPRPYRRDLRKKNVLAPAPSAHDRMSMHNANKLKIGLFGANCSSGRAVTLVPERWSGGWADNIRLARMGDDAGIDFLPPRGRAAGHRLPPADRPLEGLWRRHRLPGGDLRDRDLGMRPARRHQAGHR